MKSTGRPPKPDDLRKVNVLRIRLTEDDRRILDDAASGSTSTWARQVLLNAAKRRAKKSAD